MTERDFPAAWKKEQDHRLTGGGLFIFLLPLPGLFSNRKELPMPTNTTSALRKYWKPALATGAGGATVILWFEEILLIGLDILALIGLVLLAGPIYLYNHFVFKSATPRPEDKNQ
jgi:hypothetical protein